ncbi:ParD-like family protein [Herbaspirillum lusitanum]|jgi:hypothetical protein|uniref:ParD-like family protein n=1 Tax=Herbaspirillum lusitanum TaxID=213312 RepID=A0ABW9AFE1_9BURK
MGIVKISDAMHDNVRIAGNALHRSINAQAEHWMRLGMLAELHPELTNSEVCQLLIRAEIAHEGEQLTAIAHLAGVGASAAGAKRVMAKGRQ